MSPLYHVLPSNDCVSTAIARFTDGRGVRIDAHGETSKKQVDGHMNLSGTIWIDLAALDGAPPSCPLELTVNDEGVVKEYEATLNGL